MLEPLAGRLKWERTEDGIRMVIPARLDRQAIRYVLGQDGIRFVFYYFGITIFGALTHEYSGLHRNAVGWVEEFLIFAFVWFGFSLLFHLTSRTILTLTREMMTIEKRSSPLQSDKRKYLTERLYGLHYRAPELGSGVHPDQSEIQFEKRWKTHGFAPGINEQEASALIAKMMEVYHFPAYPSPEHLPEHSVVLDGWEPGLNKISLIKLIRDATGKSLSEAKSCADAVLDGELVEFEFSTAASAEAFRSRALSLGVSSKQEARAD